MDILRHVRLHADLLKRAARHVPEGASVLAVGCGVAPLANHLRVPVGKVISVEIDPGCIGPSSFRWATSPGDRAPSVEPGEGEAGERFDILAILSPAHLPASGTVDVLRNSRDLLRPGGRILVSGPTSSRSASVIEGKILHQLEAEGKLQAHESHLRLLQDATRTLKAERGYASSAEGMAALLRHLGFGRLLEATNDLYEGASYLVAAGR
jgi:2-polyprenyl-3-methyl-5-hydroxy-6-metoxy-1,4-benzoquinol methylase